MRRLVELTGPVALALSLSSMAAWAPAGRQALAQVAPPDQPLRVVLVLDASRLMAGAPSFWLKEAALRFVDELHLDRNCSVEAGVVRYDSAPVVLCPLTNDASRLKVCIKRVGAGGDSRPDLGIAIGMRLLAGARQQPGAAAREVMVVVSGSAPARPLPAPPCIGDGRPCDVPPRRAGDELAREVRVTTAHLTTFAVCIRPGCDPAYMRSVASSPLYYAEIWEPRLLVRELDRIRALMSAAPLGLYLPLILR